MKPVIAVIGPSASTPAQDRVARSVGVGLARRGALVICGGLGGVMAAVCQGAVEAGGTTIGLLPGNNGSQANEWVQVPIATGLGELRNGLIVRAAQAVIAIGGGHGTLSEIALALRTGRPVLGLRTWDIDGVVAVDDAQSAVAAALASPRVHHPPP